MIFFVVGAVVGAVVSGVIGLVEHSNRKERHERERREQQALAAEKANEVNQLRTTKTTLQHQVSEGHRVVNEYQATATTLKQRSQKIKTDTEALRDERDGLERDKNDTAMNEEFNQMKF
jgi:gas vesicle protein